MKYIIGILLTALILCVAVFFTLDLWGIENPITYEQLEKGLKTFMIVCATALCLVVVGAFFFKNPAKGYDKNKGNVAHPKSGQSAE